MFLILLQAHKKIGLIITYNQLTNIVNRCKIFIYRKYTVRLKTKTN